MFGYLLTLGSFNLDEPDHMYLDKQEVNFSEAGRKINMSTATVIRKFKTLVDIGVIEEGPNYYKLIRSNNFVILPVETIFHLSVTASEEEYTVFLWLARNYEKINYGDNHQDLVFTRSSLVKNALGLAPNGTTTARVSACLSDLYDKRLIDFEEFYIKDEQGVGSPRIRLTMLNKNYSKIK